MNHLDFTKGECVTLEQMLQAREERVQRQQTLLFKWQKPVVSLTLVIPGQVKKSCAASTLFQIATQAFETSCKQQEWLVLERKEHIDITGYEIQMAVGVDDARALKRQLLMLEETHMLGRLWDFDVISTRGSISRQDFALPPRRCLICGGIAHACARSQKHTYEELCHAMAAILKSYMDENFESV